MEFKDYYSILDVQPEADLKEIKAAYRRLARKYHPDVSEHTDAETRFKEIVEAWQVLKDPDKRADYDQLRAYRQSQGGQGFEPPPGWQPSGGFSWTNQGPGSGFSDFFESLFGGGGFARERVRRGQDVEMELPVFLEELVSGKPRPVAYRVPQTDEHGRRMPDQERHLNVKIPAGVSDGEVIRLKGQGAPGMGSASAGDLYLRVRLVPHPMFDVEGHNLMVTVPVAPWEAALGIRVEVPTLSSNIQLSIPPNSQNGRKLRIKGKGLPGKAGTGDLYAVIKVVMPPADSPEVKALWQRLAKETDFDPRTRWRR